MKQEYEVLFTPWKIGNIEIKNRIVMCSMGGTSIFGWMEPNHFDKEAANFLLERAKNNVGLILPGIAPIRDTLGGKWLYQNTGKFKELKDYMKEFHKTGAKLFIQLTAGMGRVMAINDIMVKMIKNKAFGTIAKPIFDMDFICASASATPNRWADGIFSRPLTVDEIQQIIEAFAKTAKLCMVPAASTESRSMRSRKAIRSTSFTTNIRIKEPTSTAALLKIATGSRPKL